MTRIITIHLLLFAGPAAALAQGPPIDPPVAGRPADFSNLVGKYAIHVSAEPTEVHVEEPITLKVSITGDGPPAYHPKREHLRLFPNWEDDFYVQEMRDEHRAMPEKKAWLFVYRLRPKHVSVSAIEGVKLVYYDPDKPGRFKFARERAKPIAIVVKPKPDLAAKIEVPLTAAPVSFYESASASAVVRSAATPLPLSGWHIAAFLLLVPTVCAAGMLAWRRCYPDAAHQEERRRSQAAQRALTRLNDPNEATWQVLRRYLRERFDFAIAEPTPADVSCFLKRRGFAREVGEQARAIFGTADALVFASAFPKTALADDAARLIHALEADPCARC